MHRIRFIVRKEILHILRDVRSLIIVIAMPIMMTFLYGYAINLDIENVTISIVDFDHSRESRDLTGSFYNSPHFSRPKVPVDPLDPESILRSARSSAILYIKPGFGQALGNGEEHTLGMTIDGSDAILAAAVQSYSNVVLRDFLLERVPHGVPVPGIMISPRVFYNPDLKSAHFFVPGLVAILMMMISALLTSITIAKEKETGTMEQLLTAPVRPSEILVGKLLPYILIALLDGILVLVFAKVVFGVPFVGAPLLLLGFGLVYVAAALSIGILISSLVATQQVAMMIALLTTMLPSVMLSGFIFAVKNMPVPLQAVSYLIPARYFVAIIRGIMLKGAGADVLAVHGLGLVVLMASLLLVAGRRFKTRVD